MYSKGKGGSYETNPDTAQSEEQIKALAELYRTTLNVRLRTRVQMVLLSVEQHMTAAAIAAIVRQSEETVRC
jgi:hypothetical protein